MAVFLREIFTSSSLMPLSWHHPSTASSLVLWSFTASATDSPFPVMSRSSATILIPARPSIAWSKCRWRISPVEKFRKAFWSTYGDQKGCWKELVLMELFPDSRASMWKNNTFFSPWDRVMESLLSLVQWLWVKAELIFPLLFLLTTWMLIQ